MADEPRETREPLFWNGVELRPGINRLAEEWAGLMTPRLKRLGYRAIHGAVLVDIARHTGLNGDNIGYPSQRRMARASGWSERSISTAVGDMVRGGVLIRRKRPGREHNVYEIVPNSAAWQRFSPRKKNLRTGGEVLGANDDGVIPSTENSAQQDLRSQNSAAKIAAEHEYLSVTCVAAEQEDKITPEGVIRTGLGLPSTPQGVVFGPAGKTESSANPEASLTGPAPAHPSAGGAVLQVARSPACDGRLLARKYEEYLTALDPTESWRRSARLASWPAIMDEVLRVGGGWDRVCDVLTDASSRHNDYWHAQLPRRNSDPAQYLLENIREIAADINEDRRRAALSQPKTSSVPAPSSEGTDDDYDDDYDDDPDPSGPDRSSDFTSWEDDEEQEIDFSQCED